MIDAAMAAIEADNPALAGVLPQIYQRPGLEGPLLGELVRLFGGLGPAEQRGRDVLGRVYEYFLTRFASAEGKNGGQFYTPRSVVRLLVAMLAPTGGTVYDPACGSGGMFVQSERFLVEHGGRHGDLKVFGQESNPTTWRLARMNLALRGIDGDLGPEHADSFHRDLHPDLRADYVLANPPFNTKDWGAARLQADPRWRFGVPPAQNANFAWVSHIIHHLAPRGLAGFVLANGAMTTSSGGEGEIRRAIVEADLVDCMVALPAQLFYSTQIPVCAVAARPRQDRPAPARPPGPGPHDRRPRPRQHGRPHPPRAPRPRPRSASSPSTTPGAATHHLSPGTGYASPTPTSPASPAASPSPTSPPRTTTSPPAATSPPPPRRGPPAPLRRRARRDRQATLRAQLCEARTLDDQLTELLDHLRRPPPTS
jgi:hypothetical protein